MDSMGASRIKFAEQYDPGPNQKMYGKDAAELMLASMPKGSNIFDIGAGRNPQEMRKLVESGGHTYSTLDLHQGENWETDPLTEYAAKFHGVIMCHALEHMLDTHRALTRIHWVLKEDGILAITVPPLKHQIVGGHVSLWNAGLLLYRLVVAGFDCSKAAVKTYGYNCSVVVRRKPFIVPELKHDHGDIGTLAKYFPMPIHGESFDGQIRELNWHPM